MGIDVYDLMGVALQEAEEGFAKGEVPVGALVASPDGRILARAHNEPVSLNDPTAHAEILAIRRVCSLKLNYRLPDTVLVVTVEPCLMCMGAALQARIERLVYGTPDPKAGAAGSLYDLPADKRLNHRMEVISGVRADECQLLMQNFFRVRRKTE
jgi:tRNA(adenine34) deaminase